MRIIPRSAVRPRGRFRWHCRTAAAALRGAFEFCIQCVVDFLIEDLCVLCGRAPPRGNGPPRAEPPGSCLVAPVGRRYLGTLVLRNHPLCPACLGGFVAARHPVELGRIERGTAVVTALGERFGPVGGRPCGAPAGGPDPGSAEGGPGGVLRVAAPFMINDNVLKLVHLAKFSGYRGLIPPMAHAMAHAYQSLGPGGAGSGLVPVPMEPTERRHRGFNPAERLARVLGDELGLAVDAHTLVKVKKTARQSRTRRERRAGNVRGAFACRGPGVRGRAVVVVDDLATTGATAASCAGELLAAGARSVGVLCFARAL